MQDSEPYGPPNSVQKVDTMQLEDMIRETVRKYLQEEAPGIIAAEVEKAVQGINVNVSLSTVVPADGAGSTVAPSRPSTTEADADDTSTGADPGTGNDGPTRSPTVAPERLPGLGAPVEVPRPITDDFVRTIAEEYSHALDAGLAPTKFLTDRYDRSRSSVSSWVRRAREAGYLPATTPGKANA